MLSPSQLAFYQENGYLMLPDYFDETAINDLEKRTEEIITEFDMDTVSIFTTNDQVRTSDDYFLGSGDKVRCFFEEDAFDISGQLKQPKSLAINKVGHAMHDIDPVWEKHSYQEKLLSICEQIDMIDPSIVQSQFIFKQPRIGGSVHAHTDSTFIYTDPQTCLGVWVALEDATVENGCLWALPKSHTKYPLKNQFIRNPEGSGTTFKTLNEEVEWDMEGLVPLEVKKGTAILLDGGVVHLSYNNTSDRSRHAFVLHLVDKAYGWSAENWLQREGQEFVSLKDYFNTNEVEKETPITTIFELGEDLQVEKLVEKESKLIN